MHRCSHHLSERENLKKFEKNAFHKLKKVMPRWEPWHAARKSPEQQSRCVERVKFCRLVLQPWTIYWETFQEMRISKSWGPSRQVRKCLSCVGVRPYPYHSIRRQIERGFSLWFDTEEWSDFSKPANDELNKQEENRTNNPEEVKTVCCEKWASKKVTTEESKKTLYKLDVVKKEQKNVQTGFVRKYCVKVLCKITV
jgi:hypothetical protein